MSQWLMYFTASLVISLIILQQFGDRRLSFNKEGLKIFDFKKNTKSSWSNNSLNFSFMIVCKIYWNLWIYICFRFTNLIYLPCIDENCLVQEISWFIFLNQQNKRKGRKMKDFLATICEGTFIKDLRFFSYFLKCVTFLLSLSIRVGRF